VDRARQILTLIVWALLAATTIARDRPQIPNHPNPPDTSTNVPISQVLGWLAEGSELGYDVYLGTSSNPPWVAAVKTASYRPASLLPSTKYFWRIVGKSAAAAWPSPTWTFTTAASGGGGGPIDCVLSAWSLSSWGPWSTCVNSQQTRTETWTRTIIVPPSNGGKACGPLSEQRTGVQSCGPPPPSPGGILLNSTSLVYEGAFRVPVGSGRQTFDWGGTALTFNPARNSLMLVGHDWYQMVGEISIPTPSKAAVLSDLPRATLLQPLTDVLRGKLGTIDGDTANGVKVGGLVVLPNSLVVTAWSYYDAGPVKQTKSHFVSGANFAALPNVLGPFQVGIGFQNFVPSDTTRIAGFVSGYMSTIPPVWQSALGGTHLTGQGGGISILSRTSSGPSATVFTPSELGVANSPTKLVMGYPTDSSNPSSPLHHPTIGEWGVNGGLYNGTQSFRAMVFPEGTRSVLFFGWGGTRFCYGLGTDNKALDFQSVPGWPGVHYCYDPVDLNKGTHGYPNRAVVFAYNADDFLAVKAGTKKPWDVWPYAIWAFSLPFQQKMVNGVDVGDYSIVGAAYDSFTKRIFLAAYRSDGAAPLIHVLRVP
jgi:hypothetical protein